MLEEMTPEQFMERYVHFRLEPWGREWEVGAAIASTIANEIRIISKSFSKQKMKASDFYQDKDFIKSHLPEFAHKTKRVRDFVPHEQAEQHFSFCLAVE